MVPAFGESLSDATGLAERLDIQTEGYIFEVKTVSNFDVIDHEFDKDEKRLTIFFNSGFVGRFRVSDLLHVIRSSTPSYC